MYVWKLAAGRRELLFERRSDAVDTVQASYRKKGEVIDNGDFILVKFYSDNLTVKIPLTKLEVLRNATDL